MRRSGLHAARFCGEHRQAAPAMPPQLPDKRLPRIAPMAMPSVARPKKRTVSSRVASMVGSPRLSTQLRLRRDGLELELLEAWTHPRLKSSGVVHEEPAAASRQPERPASTMIPKISVARRRGVIGARMSQPPKSSSMMLSRSTPRSSSMSMVA